MVGQCSVFYIWGLSSQHYCRKKYIEIHRERGSGWIIKEYPALTICGSKYALCLASATHNGDFNFINNIEFKHKSLDKIASVLVDCSSNRTFIYRTKLNEVSPLITPLMKFTSVSWGGEYMLEWIESKKSNAKLSNIFDLQKNMGFNLI